MQKLFLFVFFISLNSFAQIRYYKIDYGDLPQSIELIENDNGQFNGSINTELNKGNWNISWLTRNWRKLWNIESKKKYINDPLNEELVKNLMFHLEKDGIESIKNCRENIECNSIGFLDGSTTSFKIKTKSTEREYNFDEIYPVLKDNRETNEIRKQAQNIITTLDRFISQKESFSKAIRQLPRGKYYYFSGNSICRINTNKKRK